MRGYDRYACFIIDRNLFEKQRYDFQEVNEIYQNYTEASHKEYKEREGDYLLNWLGTNPDVPKGTLQRFYFLSAYPASDVRGVETIKTFMDFGKFTQEQFFDKSDTTAIEKLKHKIDNIDVLNIQNDNRVYLDILRNNLDEEDAELFLNVLLEKNEVSRIGKNLSEVRIIYEHILEKFAATIPQCKDNRGKINEKIIFSELENKGQFNPMLRNYCFTIWQVCSAYGAHRRTGTEQKDRIFLPTLNSINSIIYALKEVILWLGDQFQQKK